MGYSVYWNEKQARWCGYGVPAYCDHPNCTEEIDRGMGYVCGEPLQDEFGCGLYFCAKHRPKVRRPRGSRSCYENCSRCAAYKPPYKIKKPEHPHWVYHVLNDESWAQWREEHPETVAAYRNLKAEKGEWR